MSHSIISREIVISRDNVRSRKKQGSEIRELKRNLRETNKLFNISETINIKLKTLEEYKLKLKGSSLSKILPRYLPY